MWDIIFFFCLALYIGSSLLIHSSDIKKTCRHSIGMILLIISIVIWTTSLNKTSTIEKNSKKYSFKQEIRQVYKDNILVKTDTIYIIKPLKKK